VIPDMSREKYFFFDSNKHKAGTTLSIYLSIYYETVVMAPW